MTRKPSIRLIALPLANGNPTSKSLVYFYAHQLSRPTPSAAKEQQQREEGPKVPLSPPLLIKKATDLGAKQWNKLALSPKNSWKLKIYNMGERFMDKIPFEEWALKSIDPGPVPSMEEPKDGSSSQRTPDKSQIIQLLYPGSLFNERELMEGFKSSMVKCQPYHRKWMKLNILLSPVTLPVGILPLIPNLPFFYMMWRAWSHWRAYNASRYLNQMIERGYVQPTPCPILDSLYGKGVGGDKRNEQEIERTDDSSMRKEGDAAVVDDDLILSPEMVTQLQLKVNLPIECVVEISRGIQQAKLRLQLPPSSSSSSDDTTTTSASSHSSHHSS